jgi:HEAT repeat protein
MPVDELKIQALARALDTVKTLDEYKEWSRPFGADGLPFLSALYPRARKWEGRALLVYFATHQARGSNDAFQLGIAALHDKSYAVRHRACGLCAYSLRRDAIPALQALLRHKDSRTVEDARAAMDAIRHQNHHYFHDRDHCGSIFWVVNEGDEHPGGQQCGPVRRT